MPWPGIQIALLEAVPIQGVKTIEAIDERLMDDHESRRTLLQLSGFSQMMDA